MDLVRVDPTHMSKYTAVTSGKSTIVGILAVGKAVDRTIRACCKYYVISRTSATSQIISATNPQSCATFIDFEE